MVGGIPVSEAIQYPTAGFSIFGTEADTPSIKSAREDDDEECN
jgi:hypothetical protein